MDTPNKHSLKTQSTNLPESEIVTVNHLLPQLSKRVRWEEQNRSILLIGVEGQVPIAHRSKKKPIMNPLTLGTINLGYDLHEPLGLKKRGSGDP